MKRKLTSTWVFALAMVLLAGCESPYSDEYIVDMSIYHVTVLSSDEGKGTVSGGGSYQVGSQITIHATAKEHCYFTRWSDGNTQAKRQISVTSDTTLTAEFAINRYTITAYTLQEEYGQVTGSGTYDALSTITLEAVPNVKYVFVKWSDGDTNAKRQISVTSDATYIAYFKSAKGDKIEAVDLGLPSGTLWATTNIGASSPIDPGDYFAWAETKPKDYFDISNYQYASLGGDFPQMTKYTSTSREDLEPMDDAAYINLGADWRMPSLEDADELLDYCTITCSASTVRYTGPNGKSIEFPFAGMKNGDQLEKTKSAFIWTTTMDNSYIGIDGCAIAFAAYYGGSLKDDYSRYYTCLAYRATGLPIRPILKGSRQAAPSRANDASIESKSFVPNTPLHIAPSQRQHK